MSPSKLTAKQTFTSVMKHDLPPSKEEINKISHKHFISLCWHFRNDEEHARKMRESNMHLTECQKVVRSINIHNKMHKKAYVLLKGIREKHIYNNVQIHNEREIQERREQRRRNLDAFEWKNASQHFFFLVGYVMDWSAMFGLIYEGKMEKPNIEPTFIHYLVVSLTCAGAFLFLQTFIGHYTRRGCLVLGEMLPLASGVGYTMMILTLVRFIIQIYYSSILLFYMLSSFYKDSPPWMSCYEAYKMEEIACFPIEEYDLCPTLAKSSEPCFVENTKMLSACFFKQFIAFARIQMQPNNTMYERGAKNFMMEFHLLHVLIILVFLLLVSARHIRSYELGLRLTLTFAFISGTAILVVIFTQASALKGLRSRLLDVNYISLLRIDTWTAVFRRVFISLNLAEGGHYLFGSYILVSDIPTFRMLIFTLCYILLLLYFTFHYYLFEGIMVFTVGLYPKQLEIDTEENIVFVLYPTVLGSQATSRLFGFVYFLLLFLISFNSMVLKLFVIEGTITMSYKLGDYYFYIRSFIVIISVLATFPLSLKDEYETINSLILQVKQIAIAVILIQFIVFFIYGMQRICDDVQFCYNKPISYLARGSWIFTPVACLITIYYTHNYVFRGEHEVLILVGFFLILVLPLFVCAILEICSYARKKNLIGLLRPKDSFGSPDVENRIMRILYNPRFAVKYKKPHEFCNHQCLLKNDAIKVAIGEEIKLIKKFITELDSSRDTTDANTSKAVASELIKHQSMLEKHLRSKH